MALYNKWRGQTFSDLLGQEHITTTLQNQIRAGRIGHAYLFTGLRGTGKTSTARILAKAINCVGGVSDPPCNRCHICTSLTDGRSLDLIEIDGASNRGVDEIRDLRDRVNFSPSECRYKVYVIDEVHMLTREAFNALLKTLEEPPAHVVFIMCTTEPHRLPDTVLSRCQRYDFRRGSLATITAKLQHIATQEAIAIRPEALEYIARRATGSYRDAESLLDQLSAYSAGDAAAPEIGVAEVQAILGAVAADLVGRVAQAALFREVPEGLRAIHEAFDRGAEPRQFLDDITTYLRALMLIAVGGDDDALSLGPGELAEAREVVGREGFSLGRVVGALRRFGDAAQSLRYAVRPELPLELALVEVALQPATSPAVAAPQLAAPQSAAPQSPFTREKAGPAPRRAAPQRSPATVGGDAGGRAPAVEHPPAERPPAERPPAEPPPPLARPTLTPAAPAADPEPEPPVTELAGAASEAPAPEDGAPAPEDGAPPGRALTLDWVTGHWRQCMIRMRALNQQLEALLNSAQPVEVRANAAGAPGLPPVTIVFGCEAEFHREKLSEDKRRAVVEQVLTEVLGTPCAAQFVVGSVRRRPGVATGGASGAPSADLFATDDPRRKAEDQLRNHPAVRELERHGGVVTGVHLNETDDTEETRGK